MVDLLQIPAQRHLAAFDLLAGQLQKLLTARPEIGLALLALVYVVEIIVEHVHPVLIVVAAVVEHATRPVEETIAVDEVGALQHPLQHEAAEAIGAGFLETARKLAPSSETAGTKPGLGLTNVMSSGAASALTGAPLLSVTVIEIRTLPLLTTNVDTPEGVGSILRTTGVAKVLDDQLTATFVGAVPAGKPADAGTLIPTLPPVLMAIEVETESSPGGVAGGGDVVGGVVY